MATVTLYIPNEFVSRVVPALKRKYFELMPGETGAGMTDPQIAMQAIRRWVIQSVKQIERIDAVNDIVINVPDEIITGDIDPTAK